MEQLNQNNIQQESDPNAIAPVVVYPTEQNTEGFFFETKEDFENGVWTKIYPNDRKVKKIVLPRSGNTALVRELVGRDNKEISRYMGKESDNYQMASLTVSTTINGEKQTMEFFESLKLKDLNLIIGVHTELNF